MAYSEKASSVKKRPVFDQMMRDAALRKVDVVLVWKLDRFARSLTQMMDSISRLDSAGVRFICLTQSIDTDRQNAAGRLMMQMIGAFAEFERSIIVERTIAGVREAQRKGVHCGRPKRVWSRDEALRLQVQGWSLRQIAGKLGVSHVTIATELRAVKKP